jgi:hypothetical protein
MQEATSPRFDFLILADRADAINGKLYMMGGGWDNIQVANLEEPVTLSVAIAIMVPWLATNQDHLITLRLVDEDDNELIKLQVGFKTGRPPTLPDAETQRVMLALPLSLKFPKAGKYTVVGTVGDDEKRVGLRIIAGPPMRFPPQPS